MEKKQKTLAAAGVGIAAAAALGLTGAALAGAADGDSRGTSEYGYGAPGVVKGMREGGGTLSADAASRAVSAALAEVAGGTVQGVHARSDGTYVVDVKKGDDTRVRVLVDESFAVTSVEEGGPRGPGGRGPGRGMRGGVAPTPPGESGATPPAPPGDSADADRPTVLPTPST